MRRHTSSRAATPEGSIQHWQQQKTGCSKYGIDAHVEGRKAEDAAAAARAGGGARGAPVATRERAGGKGGEERVGREYMGLDDARRPRRRRDARAE